jgi:hypothetical protein
MLRSGHRAEVPDPSPGVDNGRTLGASLFTPAGTDRSERRRRRSEARGIGLAHRKALMNQRRAEIEALKAEQRAAAYLPRGGEAGPAALRSYRRLKVQSHRATSDVLAGAYPFLAEAGLGADGVLIGQDSWSGAAFVYDPWVLYTKCAHQPEPALGRRHRQGQIDVGQKPGDALHRLWPEGLRAR